MQYISIILFRDQEIDLQMSSVEPATVEPVTVGTLIERSIKGCLHGNHDCKKSDYVPKRNVIIFLDRSGSTNAPIKMGQEHTTVWDFEREVFERLVLANPKNTYFLMTFDHDITGIANKDGQAAVPMRVIIDYQLILPLRSSYEGPRRGITMTHLVFEYFNNHPEYHEAVVITDGKTDSSQAQVLSSMSGVTRPISIIAVSDLPTNLDSAGTRETQLIPGLDIVNYLGNRISQLKVFNPIHWNDPYVGSRSSQVQLFKFMGTHLPCTTIRFLQQLLQQIDRAARANARFDFGRNNVKFMEMCAEIGSLLSLTNASTFSPDAQVFKNLRLFDVLTLCRFAQDNICKWLQMGWNATRTSTPVNMVGHTLLPIVPVEAKQAQFSNAATVLVTKGLTAGSTATIGIDLKIRTILCVEDSSYVPPEPALGLPNSGFQEMCIFSTSEHVGQPTRQGLRKFILAMGGNAGADRETFVIFFFCKILVWMMMTGDDTRHPNHFKKLQELALIQCDMQPMIRKGEYGQSFRAGWLQSIQPRLHFGKATTCSSLFTDNRINPWGESERVWWALMMAALGKLYFAAQHEFYRSALIDAGMSSDQLSIQNLIALMLEKHPVSGQMSFATIQSVPISLGSLEPFTDEDVVFSVEPHQHARSEQKGQAGLCDTKQYYSSVDRLMFNYTCGWCGATDLEYKRVEIEDNKTIVSEALRAGTPFRVCPRDAKAGMDAKRTTLYATPEQKDTKTPSVPALVSYVFLHGPPGSGKSTATSAIVEQLGRMNIQCFVASPDVHSRIGQNPGDHIPQALDSFLTTNASFPHVVVIFDNCNQTSKAKMYRRKIVEIIGTEIHSFIPTMRFGTKIELQNSIDWALKQLFLRGAHTSTTPWWLNPVSSSSSDNKSKPATQICLSVFRQKTEEFMRGQGLAFAIDFLPETLTHMEVLQRVEQGAVAHEQTLRPVADVVAEFIQTALKIA